MWNESIIIELLATHFAPYKASISNRFLTESSVNAADKCDDMRTAEWREKKRHAHTLTYSLTRSTIWQQKAQYSNFVQKNVSCKQFFFALSLFISRISSFVEALK